MVIPVWRKQPIYVVRRTPDMVARIAGHDGGPEGSESKDSTQPPYAKNAQRSRTPEFLVLIGTCTHLGCLPKQRFAAGELVPELAGRVLLSLPRLAL